MKITKLGHCCLIIEEKGVKIMTDPGAYTILQNEIKGVDFIFITHEHQDHFHLESLKIVLRNNPKAKIITNKSVGKLLDIEKIPYEILENGGAREFGGVHVEGHGEKHALIYSGWKEVENTGYFFAERFFYPGDAFYNPNKEVEILALPVAGPWMKISEAVDYAKDISPKVCFPVHDAQLKFNQPTRSVPKAILEPLGINFADILEGDSVEF